MYCDVVINSLGLWTCHDDIKQTEHPLKEVSKVSTKLNES